MGDSLPGLGSDPAPFQELVIVRRAEAAVRRHSFRGIAKGPLVPVYGGRQQRVVRGAAPVDFTTILSRKTFPHSWIIT